MSFASHSSPFEPYSNDWKREQGPWLAEQFCNVSQFLRGMRIRMRHGELTRAPLQLLRLNILGKIVRCDWLARKSDPWDRDLAQNLRERHASLQALRDAINVRALLFDTMPDVETADLRVYRELPNYQREMIITGCVQRNDHSSRNIHSLAMRAKILGFRFHLDSDTLAAIQAEDQNRVVD